MIPKSVRMSEEDMNAVQTEIKGIYRGVWGRPCQGGYVELEVDGQEVLLGGQKWIGELMDAGLEKDQEIAVTVTEEDGEYSRPRKARIL